MSERERGRTRLSTESPPPPPLHHSLLLARGSECGTGHPTLFPLPHSRPPPADPLLRMNSFIIFPPFVIFMSTSLRFIIIILFSLLLCPLVLFSELSYSSLSHSFCHGQGKENDRPPRLESQRGTAVRGELRTDLELKDARSRSPPDGLSRAENSECQREKSRAENLRGWDDRVLVLF